MEFKEFKNPEEEDYDIKVGVNNITPNSKVIDNSLNTDEGIDLNALGGEEINEFEGKSR